MTVEGMKEVAAHIADHLAASAQQPGVDLRETARAHILNAVVRAAQGQEAIEDLFGLMSQNSRGEWCFNALSRDWTEFQNVMKRLAKARTAFQPPR